MLRLGRDPERLPTAVLRPPARGSETLGLDSGYVVRLYLPSSHHDTADMTLTPVSDWDDVADHHDFMKTEAYKDFFGLCAPVFDFESGPPHLVHVNYASHPPNGARDAPVTEFACFALDSNTEDKQKSAMEDNVLNLVSSITKTNNIPWASGWVVEDLDHEKGTNGKAIGFSLLAGWESKEAHMKARESQDFLDAAGPVRGMALPPTPGYTGTTVYHAKMTKA